MARRSAALRKVMTQADRWKRYERIQNERLDLEKRLLHLDAEEASLLARCEHTTEEGESFSAPFCPLCGGIIAE